MDNCPALDIAYKVASIIVPMVAMYAIYISIKHLKEIKRDTKLNTAYAEIDIFEKLSKKQDQYYKSMHEVIKTKEEDINKPEALFRLEIANKEKIDFLNLLDTVCLYVRNGCITRSNFKRQYKQPLNDIVETYKDSFNQISMYDNIKILNEEFNKEDLIGRTKSNNSYNTRTIRSVLQIISCILITYVGACYALSIFNESQNIQIFDFIFPDKYAITKIVYSALVLLLFLVSLDGNQIKEKSLKSLTRFFSGIIFLVGLYYIAQKSDLEELKDIKPIKILISLMITYFYIFFIVDVVGILINLFFTRMSSQTTSKTHP
ncbi:hypothetical protein [Campylobacter concisus]|uniref:hypothetical protein n=1 Tax=Campylobacter concisus TaxID=199 RepID=UPI000D39A1D7|nr:hypothetical protein [Campylobacter concisus]